MSPSTKSWRCEVCGYIHQGDTPPEYCPVCGAAAGDFSSYGEPAPAAPQKAADRWRCMICNFIHEGPQPPAHCPLCGAEANQFEAYAEQDAPDSTAGAPQKVVIIGGGIAGVSAAESIRKHSAESEITLISAEPRLPYYRLNLTRYLAGEVETGELTIHPAAWYAENRIELLAGVRAEAIATEARTVALDSGKTLSYDRLILAAGAHPFVPPVQGCNLDGVHTLRTITDAERIMGEVRKGMACLCIGGGILGMETAGALAKRGVAVTLLESHEWLMPRQLNRAAATRMEAHLSTLGITLRKSAFTRELIGNNGRIAGVALDSGEVIPCELAVLCTGVRPNTALARKAGLEVECGIVVDNHLRTSDPSVFAAGDIAEHNGVVYGIWGPSQYQGAIAGLNALECVNLFGGVPRSNTIKVLGIEMLSIGEFTPPDGGYRVIEEQDDDNFRHFVFHDGRMTGAILLGSIEPAARIKRAIEAKKDFSGILAGSPKCADIIAAL